MTRHIGRMRRDLIGNDAVFHVFVIGQAEVLFRSDVAEHRRAMPADERRANRGGNVVVAGGDVDHQRAQRIEGSAVAKFDFLVHLLLDLVERHVAGAFDHHLHIAFPGFCRQLAQGFKLGKLRFVAGIGNAAGTQAVAQRITHVVLSENLGDLVEVIVEEVLLVVMRHPLRQDRATAAYDAGNATGDHGQEFNQHAGVDGHVIDTLLRLLLDNLEHHVDGEVFNALHARDCLVNRNRADGHRRVPQNGFADIVNVAAGGEVHDGIGAIVYRGVQLLQLFVNVTGDGRVADVGVDLAARLDADGHRLQFGMVDVGRDDHASGSHFVADEFGRNFFALGHEDHLFGEQALARKVHLRHVGVAAARGLFAAPGDPFGAGLQNARATAVAAVVVTHKVGEPLRTYRLLYRRKMKFMGVPKSFSSSMYHTAAYGARIAFRLCSIFE